MCNDGKVIVMIESGTNQDNLVGYLGMTFGEYLRYLREENSMTQDEVAELLGVTHQAVGSYEKDLALPKVENLIKYREIFGLPGPEEIDDVFWRIFQIGNMYAKKQQCIQQELTNQQAERFKNMTPTQQQMYRLKILQELNQLSK